MMCVQQTNKDHDLKIQLHQTIVKIEKSIDEAEKKLCEYVHKYINSRNND